MMVGHFKAGASMRRILSATLVATTLVATLGLAGSALAQPPGETALTAVSFTPAFQTTVQNDIGATQGEALKASVARAVSAALARRGAAVSGVTIAIEVVDAVPNRTSVQHLRANYLLDPGRTVQLGGAEFHALLRSAGGQTLAEVAYSHYDHAFDDLVGPPSMWTSANRAAQQFAERVADAYVAQNSAR